MRSASGPLQTLLNSGDFVKADLWTFTLSGGTVLRWTDADIPLDYSGNTFNRGPVFEREGIEDKMGLEVSTLEFTVSADDDDLVSSTPFIQLISSRGLDGANIKLERAFLPDWGQPVTGAVTRFSGKITSIGETGGNSASITASSWAILLNVSVPPNLYQAPCMHIVYDGGCGLNENSFSSTGAVASTVTNAYLFNTNLSLTTGDFDQGKILFLSGTNAGITRSIKKNTSGLIELNTPLPNTPAIGDSIKVFKGCDLSMATCSTRFNNLLRFKGTPFVPVAETAI